jgi:hypothetical protein
MKLIGINGIKHSGKDLSSNILACIHNRANNPYTIENVIYDVNYLLSKSYVNDARILKIILRDYYDTNSLAFGDCLKQIVSILYDIPIELMYNHLDKDDRYYDLINRKTYSKRYINDKYPEKYHYLDISNKDNIKSIYSNNTNEINRFIELRKLIQCVGTDIMRNNFGENIFIQNIFRKLIKSDDTLNIITDVRFDNEAKAIKYLGGIIIHVHNNDNNYNVDDHISEKGISHYDYNINWSSKDENKIEVLTKQLIDIYNKLQ